MAVSSCGYKDIRSGAGIDKVCYAGDSNLAEAGTNAETSRRARVDGPAGLRQDARRLLNRQCQSIGLTKPLKGFGVSCSVEQASAPIEQPVDTLRSIAQSFGDDRRLGQRARNTGGGQPPVDGKMRAWADDDKGTPSCGHTALSPWSQDGDEHSWKWWEGSDEQQQQWRDSPWQHRHQYSNFVAAAWDNHYHQHRDQMYWTPSTNAWADDWSYGDVYSTSNASYNERHAYDGCRQSGHPASSHRRVHTERLTSTRTHERIVDLQSRRADAADVKDSVSQGKRRGKKKGKKKSRKRKRKPRRPDSEEEDEQVLSAEEREEKVRRARAAVSDALPAEPSRDMTLLELLKDRSDSGGAWDPYVSNDHLRSWAYIRRSDPRIRDDDLQTLIDRVEWTSLTAGKDNNVTRKTAWLVRDGCRCQYKYGKELVDPISFPQWMLDMIQRWLQCFNFTAEDLPNCVNLNLYENDGQAVGWHADDEPLFQGKRRDARIISVSLGAARRFRIGMREPPRLRGGKMRRRPQPETHTVSSVDLCHGDICTMEGLFQKHYVHQIKRGKSLEPEPRVNATFRWIVHHECGCPLHVPGDDSSAASDDVEDDDDDEDEYDDDGQEDDDNDRISSSACSGEEGAG
eukprot:TRINITY_DN62804_c0_g1_i1.p1 TRINITY_DN62804_c0_g1~~TRINITY_DN62804_c0_g1_i1.p1  ORF type:complete len:627 (+),score=53.63 TRINITY_DN62804_c0_g1_i1:41-1921(+)